MYVPCHRIPPPAPNCGSSLSPPSLVNYGSCVQIPPFSPLSPRTAFFSSPFAIGSSRVTSNPNSESHEASASAQAPQAARQDRNAASANAPRSSSETRSSTSALGITPLEEVLIHTSFRCALLIVKPCVTVQSWMILGCISHWVAQLPLFLYSLCRAVDAWPCMLSRI